MDQGPQTKRLATAALGRQSSSAPRRAFGEAWCWQTAPLDGVYLLSGHVLAKEPPSVDISAPFWASTFNLTRRKKCGDFGWYMVHMHVTAFSYDLFVFLFFFLIFV